jgi:hypothetical protein
LECVARNNTALKGSTNYSKRANYQMHIFAGVIYILLLLVGCFVNNFALEAIVK